MPNVPTPSPWTSSWNPQVNLDSPAGRTIRELVQLVPAGTRIILFGSAPLELSLDPTFSSEDVDCFGPSNLKELVDSHGLSKASRKPYVQVCAALNFRTTPMWSARAYSLLLDGRVIVIPHPIDILIGKLHRLEEKDLRAFKLVRDKTGHPTEQEMIDELQSGVDLFRPGFDEEKATDMKGTTRILWQEFFGHDIDVVEIIIRPALRRREEGYAPDNPSTDYKAELSRLSESWATYTIPGFSSTQPPSGPTGN